jgi:hypothetical protein
VSTEVFPSSSLVNDGTLRCPGQAELNNPSRLRRPPRLRLSDRRTTQRLLHLLRPWNACIADDICMKETSCACATGMFHANRRSPLIDTELHTSGWAFVSSSRSRLRVLLRINNNLLECNRPHSADLQRYCCCTVSFSVQMTVEKQSRHLTGLQSALPYSAGHYTCSTGTQKQQLISVQ